VNSLPFINSHGVGLPSLHSTDNTADLDTVPQESPSSGDTIDHFASGAAHGRTLRAERID
jgi:hypothetical protein